MQLGKVATVFCFDAFGKHEDLLAVAVHGHVGRGQLHPGDAVHEAAKEERVQHGEGLSQVPLLLALILDRIVRNAPLQF